MCVFMNCFVLDSKQAFSHQFFIAYLQKKAMDYENLIQTMTFDILSEGRDTE